MQQMVRFLRGDLLIERVQDQVGLRRFDERAAIRFIEALGARLLLRRQSARLTRAADAAVCTRHNLDQIEMLFSGRLQIRNWQDKEGNKRRSAEVVADNVYFGESKRDSMASSGFDQTPPPVSYQAPANPAASSDFSTLMDDDPDLPF